MNHITGFCLIVLSLFVASGVSQSLPPEEQTALTDLATTLNLVNDLYCDSDGITCQEFDNETLHVISIDLPSAYQGSTCDNVLAPSFSAFSYLVNLTLAGNCLSLQNLTEYITSPYLRLLDLSLNFFDAAVPTDPEWWATLENLQFLNLASCYYQQWPILANITSLRVVAIQNNGINDVIPDWIGTLTGLQYLDISGNQLHGTIPPSIGALSQLSYLNMASNKLSGSLPDEMGGLVSLTNFYISSNAMNGTVSENISNWVQLVVFTAAHNSFVGSLPTNIGNLVNLVTLDFTSNKLSGDIPDSICNCAALQYMKFGNNQLTGFPTCSGELSDILIVDLTNNKISSPLPPDVSKLTNLTIMLLSGNHFYGPLPPSVWSLPSLQILDVSNNQLSGGLPDSGYTGSVFQVNLQNNKLNGSLPAAIVELPKLAYLFLYNNQFSGTIENINFTMASFSTLNLANNSFTGSIPETLGYMTSLQNLDLSFNQFTGIVPYTLSYLAGSLSVLKLNSNYGLRGKVSEILDNLFPDYYGSANFSETGVCCALDPSDYPLVTWPSQCADCNIPGQYGLNCSCGVPRPVEGAVCHLGRYVVDCGADVDTNGGNITIDAGGLQIVGNFISNDTSLYIVYENSSQQVGEVQVLGNVSVDGGLVNLNPGPNVELVSGIIYTVLSWNGSYSGSGYLNAVVEGGQACQQVDPFFTQSETTLSVVLSVNNKLCESPSDKKESDDTTTIIIVCVCIVVAILAAVGIIVAFKIRRMRRKGMLFEKLQVTDTID